MSRYRPDRVGGIDRQLRFKSRAEAVNEPSQLVVYTHGLNYQSHAPVAPSVRPWRRRRRAKLVSEITFNRDFWVSIHLRAMRWQEGRVVAISEAAASSKQSTQLLGRLRSALPLVGIGSGLMVNAVWIGYLGYCILKLL